MAKLFVLQHQPIEKPVEWYVCTSNLEIQNRFDRIDRKYKKAVEDEDEPDWEDWQIQMSDVYGPHCAYLIGFNQEGKVFAEPIYDVRGYELNTNNFKQTTAYLIGPESEDGKITVTPGGRLKASKGLQILAYWEKSEIKDDNIPGGTPVVAAHSGPPKPGNYDEVLKVAKVMKAEWDKVNAEDKGPKFVKGLPDWRKPSLAKGESRAYAELMPWQAKFAWFANVLNTAIFKCTKNPMYSKTELFSRLKKEKNFFLNHPKLRGIHDSNMGYYFKWPENVTKEANKIASAAGKDQEIIVKATYLLCRDWFANIQGGIPEDEMKSKVNSAGEEDYRYMAHAHWGEWCRHIADWILTEVDDPDINREAGKWDSPWAEEFRAFESVQRVKQLKYVQLFEGFVNTLKTKSI